MPDLPTLAEREPMSDSATGQESPSVPADPGKDISQADQIASAIRASQIAQRVAELVQAVQQKLEVTPRPRATYRIQFHRDFKFADATALASYWKSLGISDVYASPYLKAVAGSTHGYDIVDHGRLNPELGTDSDF